MKNVPRLKPAPDTLAWLIENVNLVPPSEVLVKLPELPPSMRTTFQGRFSAEQVDLYAMRAFHQIIVDHTDHLPTQFHYHLWSSHFTDGEPEPPDVQMPEPQSIAFAEVRSTEWYVQYFCEGPKKRSLEEYMDVAEDRDLALQFYISTVAVARGKYEFIRTARENLLKIIDLTHHPIEGVHLFNVLGRIQISSDVLINDDGALWLRPDRFGSAVDGIEARRLRNCLICARIFWAGRIDAQCCSSNCARALRNRRYRERRAQGFYQGGD